MRRFEAFPSKSKIAGLLLIGSVLIATSVFCTTLPELYAKIAGWTGVIFFGLCQCAVGRRLFQTSVVKIAMDDAGIHTGSSQGVVEWSDVIGFRIDSLYGNKFLSIFVRDVEKYLARMPPLARQSAQTHPNMGLSEITLSFTGLTPGLSEACHYLAERGFQVENW